MGESLWWVMQDMLLLTEKRKLILVITDGDPDSADCANQAIKQGLLSGFEIYGVGITSSSIMSLLPGFFLSIVYLLATKRFIGSIILYRFQLFADLFLTTWWVVTRRSCCPSASSIIIVNWLS